MKRICAVPRLVLSSFVMWIGLASCSSENNDSYMEHFADPNGDKPEEFKFAYERSCLVSNEKTEAEVLSSIQRFASSRGMSRIIPDSRGRDSPIVAYSRGMPMRVHLVVKRVAENELFVGISTERGLGCEDCAIAEKKDIGCLK